MIAQSLARMPARASDTHFSATPIYIHGRVGYCLQPLYLDAIAVSINLNLNGFPAEHLNTFADY